jgi:Ca-activated chloride channel family protein
MASPSGTLTFAWPWALMLLGLGPLWMLWVWRAGQAKRWEGALQFSPLAALTSAEKTSRIPFWRRAVLPLCLMLTVCLLSLAFARPVITRRVPVRAVDMMLIMDISLSMLATDIPPSRLDAARDAAIRFIRELPEEVRVGLVLFAGQSYVLSEPTADHQALIGKLETLDKEDVETHTALGTAIRAAVMAMVPQSGKLRAFELPSESGSPGTNGASSPEKTRQPERAMILLSDGDSWEGYPWSLAAQEARRLNIRVFTVGVGTDQPTLIEYHGELLPVAFSEANLREIARLAGGQYFRVSRQGDFSQVYRSVADRAIRYETRTQELAGLLAGLALLLLLAGWAAGQRLHRWAL